MTDQIKFKYDIQNGAIEYEGAHELLKPTLKSLAKMFNGGSKASTQKKSSSKKTKSHASAKPSKPTSANRGTKKRGGKQSYSMDKTLNLFPSDKKTIKDFAEEKAPTSQKVKCVIVVYYLTQTLEKTATTDRIYTCFKALNWPIPKNLDNILSQAGSAGWLDTSDNDDIKLVPTGENLVEQELPKKPKE